MNPGSTTPSSPPPVAIVKGLEEVQRQLGWPPEVALLVPPRPARGAAPPDRLVSSSTRWVSPDALSRPDDPTLGALVSANADRLETTDRVAAGTLLWKDYCQAVCGLAVGSWAMDRRVPDVSVANSALAVDESSWPLVLPALIAPRAWVLPSDPCRSDANAMVATDAPALLTQLGDVLWHRHLAMVSERFRLELRISERIVTGLAVSVAVAVVAQTRARTRSDPFQQAIALVRALQGESLLDLATLIPPSGPPEPLALRFVCCLAHRVAPFRNCSTCPLISADERTELLGQYGYGWSPS